MTPEPSRILWNNKNDENQSLDQQPSEGSSQSQAPIQERLTPTLDSLGRDITKLARERKLNPLFGREKELLRLQRILLRKQKSNPLLIGAPGLGKTALVEGFASLIADGKSNQNFRDIRIVEIIPSMIIAGTSLRGSFEEKLQSILTESRGNSTLILFIDEIHTLIHAGSVEGGTLDAANILKPALARGEIRCIGATTSDEYDQFD